MKKVRGQIEEVEMPAASHVSKTARRGTPGTGMQTVYENILTGEQIFQHTLGKQTRRLCSRAKLTEFHLCCARKL
jgi:hypothetical protein